ncbi:MAG: hypothetical protein ACI81P_000743, partial [Neolewinella sp.]
MRKSLDTLAVFSSEASFLSVKVKPKHPKMFLRCVKLRVVKMCAVRRASPRPTGENFTESSWRLFLVIIRKPGQSQAHCSIRSFVRASGQRVPPDKTNSTMCYRHAGFL